MPRKSARLLLKSKSNAELATSENLRKRRKTTDGETGNIVAINRRQHFRIQNKRLPISHTDAITTSMIVPEDEVDAMLACSEQLPLPSASGDYDDEEVVHIFTTPMRQHQLFRFSNILTSEMNSPLPPMDWAESQAVWEAMMEKEELYSHSPDIFRHHPDIKPHMRGILLTWLTEVCEVYKLHKETYYLSVDLIDRFLALSDGMKTDRLQLLGVTALFIASKIEEIYPPKSTDFAYVADGAFDVEEIHQFELLMVKVLGWNLSPMTANTWVQIYLQMNAVHNAASKPPVSQLPLHCRVRSVNMTPTSPSLFTFSPLDLNNSGMSDLVASTNYIDLTRDDETRDDEDSTASALSGTASLRSCRRSLGSALRSASCPPPQAADETDSSDEAEPEINFLGQEDYLMYSRFSPNDYVQVTLLLDLVVLDSHCLRFKKSVLAATALYLSCSLPDICKVTGLKWEKINQCLQWMRIHQDLISKHHSPETYSKPMHKVSENDAHKIQHNTISKELWETALNQSVGFFKFMDMHAPPEPTDCNPVETAATSSSTCGSPCMPGSFITPPRSCRKVMTSQNSLQQ